MRIVTQIWISFIILLCGYAATVVINDTLSRKGEAFLQHAQADVLPAMIAAQEASTAFKQLFQANQDAVVFGDATSLERAAPLLRQLDRDLERIAASTSLGAVWSTTAAGCRTAVADFAHDAEPTYRALAHGDPDAAVQAQAARLQQRYDGISAALDQLTAGLKGALAASMTERTVTGTRERMISELVLTVVVLAAFGIIITITMGWSKRLTALIDASHRMSAGDYDTAIVVSGRDEVSLLADGFSQMRESIRKRNRELQEFNGRLESEVSERTGELKAKNNDLLTQMAERQRVEHSLRLLEVAVGQIAEGVVISAPELAASRPPDYANAGFRSLFALSPEDALAGGLATLFAGHVLPPELEEACAMARAGQSRTIETALVLADQRECVIEWHVAPIRDGAGRITNLVSIMRDLTERKAQDAQRQQGAKLESIGLLAAGVAHEINTPIQFIGDNLRFLGDAFGDLVRVMAAKRSVVEACRAAASHPELVEAVDAVARSADLEYLRGEIPKGVGQALEGVNRVAEIVRAMKEFSHPDQQEMAPADIAKAITTTLIVARTEYKYVADVVTDFDPDLPLVPCLVGEFNQVILNLVVNAAHAIADAVGTSNARGTITISAKRNGGNVEVRVGDTGTGIPPAARAHIFAPFFTTKPVGKGTGQGLSHAHTVVTKKHGGTITFETQVGKGTTFIIGLPMA